MNHLPKVCLIAALLFLSTFVFAQLPPAFDATLSEGLQPSDAGTAISNSGPRTISGTFNGVSTLATALGGFDPSVFAKASGSVNGTDRTKIYGEANAGAIYDFEIMGPGAVSSVPVVVTGSLTAIANNDPALPLGGSIAQVEITPGGDFEDLVATWSAASQPNPSSSPSSVSMDSTIDFNSGVIYQVNLTAFASVGNLVAPATTDVSGSAQASIDPIFTIDPSFLIDNAGFSLDFSPNLNTPPPNLNPVPESSDWGMIAGALAIFFGGIRFCRGSQRPSSP